jgi:putative tryptophan/tyrosine transport system substrate-binding protein
MLTEAQQPTKISRIGYLSATARASDSDRVEAIRLALRELGYIEGQNIAIEYRYAEGKLDRVPELAAELVRLKEPSHLRTATGETYKGNYVDYQLRR